ncbi:hypothetical protein BXY70_0536 [Roseovarius halotolerans]|uniref:Uncharacterized protein n=1 Tax=Roseovarius halotolerans TaxID=505353 RepID=A0A1X6YII7_9RHOB|nr:hypothetical protein [Roseovarius halotolerans]RKT34518.1 hypothetical protein BXY70_0536 [Roseovarius halotolerans]SLN22377.1 hypothetical protein ROH8110_00859 [Roseovarius halotolerans]
MEALPIILGLVAVAALVAALARSRAVSERKSPRGCEPGQGDQLVDIGYASGGSGGGHGGVIRVTRDPQQYARAFVPSRALKADRNTKD